MARLGTSVRSLSALRDASSARVFNLLQIQRKYGTTDEYRRHPLFESQTLNSAILLKHRLRPDEDYLFDEPVRNATKIVLPLDRSDLRLGGTSFFYGQRGYLEFIRNSGNYQNYDMTFDVKKLDLLNELPSFDPFLVHERFSLEGIEVADCYFDLSEGDKRQMQDFVAKEIASLIYLAYRTETLQTKQTKRVISAARLSSAILAMGAEDQLEPLRRSLLLEGDEFRRGIFSWRGFLYYKWKLVDMLPRVLQVYKEIAELPLMRGDRMDDLEACRRLKRQLGERVTQVSHSVTAAIAVYDTHYRRLTEDNEPQHFRDFLLNAPHMFVELGEKFGGLSHVESFWRYRFPKRRQHPIRTDDAMPILVDFAYGLGMRAEEID